MHPLVSVLIPAYNAERTISDTILSAIGQTWPRTEIIIVNDGSTDNTLAVAEGYSADKIKVITQRNGGASSARNSAFLNSHGDYIQWLDADDILAPGKIEAQMKRTAYHSKRTLWSGAFGTFSYRTSSAKFKPTALWCDLPRDEWLLRRWEHSVFLQPATWLVSRELTNVAGPWDVRLSTDDDGEYFTRVVLSSDEIKFVRESEVFYRRGFESLSFIGGSKKKLESQCLSIALQLAQVSTLSDKRRVHAACVKFLQDHLNYLYVEDHAVGGYLNVLAAEYGGKLVTPNLHPMYLLIKRLLGFDVARMSRTFSRRLRSQITKWSEKVQPIRLRQ